MSDAISIVDATGDAQDAAPVVATVVDDSPKMVLQNPNGTKTTLTTRQYKEAMRHFFTVRLGKVMPCEHRYDPNIDPRTNCENCWWAYFNNHKEMVESIGEMFQEVGKLVEDGRLIVDKSDPLPVQKFKAAKRALISMRGEKFTKFYIRFVSTVARMMAQQVAQEAAQTEREAHGSDDKESSRPDAVRTIGGIPEDGGIPSADDASGVLGGPEAS